MRQKLYLFLTTLRDNPYTDFNNWLGRFVVWTSAIVAGLVVVLFARLSEKAVAFFFGLQHQWWWSPLLLTPLAGVLIVWLTNRWFDGAGGSGIPQTIAAIHDIDAKTPQTKLISLKIAFGKIVLGAGALAAGFSAGREGPSVQVAASIMHTFRRFLPAGFSVDPKHLVLAGGAAGISAAFNTPLAGVVFAIEELGRRFEQKTNGIVITAIVLSGLVSISLSGNYTYFGSLDVGMIDRRIIAPVLLCGVICGVLGGIFSRTLIKASASTHGYVGRLRVGHPLRWAGFCGLMVALLGLASHGAAHGSGYIFTQEMLAGTAVHSWFYAPFKYLATIFTYLSGVPGGIFAPSLSIGAGIASDLIPFFGQPLALAVTALCMAAFLAAVTQAPITTFIIVMEMINGHEMVISLMAVTLIATIVARLFSPPLYSSLAQRHLLNTNATLAH